ncbi:MAG: glutathione S-transferase [Roseateles depolymerans]|uniref:Glutathione S-transferase n=1 Tax=Roseateles depolymerans TaxID=76731 RepID=A0A2W5E1K6_9BURK|nr:MAG: glutathione S-transferase [Roseateles depolymerans]
MAAAITRPPVSTPRRQARKPVPEATPAPAKRRRTAPHATLTLSSKNYSSWSLRGWLLARFAGLAFEEVMVSPDDADARKELLLLAPSILVPCLRLGETTAWNTLAIAETLAELFPRAALWPADPTARAHARSVCGEMNSGFANLRSALPMNLKGHFPRHKVWAGAKPDIERIVEIWVDCLTHYGGPFLFGRQRGAADAMFAPVATRFLTYDVALPDPCAAYCRTLLAMPEMLEWTAAARLEPDEIEQLDMDF